MLHSQHQNIVEQVRQVTDRCIQRLLDTGKPIILSKLISQELNIDSSKLNSIVVSRVGKTLDNFILLRIIEKVKELLVYTDQSLSFISSSLGYSNAAYLSAQLKRHTGFSAAHYKQIRHEKHTIMKNNGKQK